MAKGKDDPVTGREALQRHYAHGEKATVADALDWDALMRPHRPRVEQVIRRDGAFRITAATAIFVCS